MNTYFYYLFSMVMLSRLVFQSGDGPITKKGSILKGLLELTALILVSNFQLNLLWLSILIILLNIATYFIDEKMKADFFIYRFMILLAYSFVFSIFFSEKTNLIIPNKFILSIKQFLECHNVLFFIIKKVSWKYFLVFLSGALLAANEVNYVIRFVLSKLKVEPHKHQHNKTKTNSRTQVETNEKDTAELKRGRIIGIIERILIYYFIIEGSLASIGFILAAKSFTRFKELDDKDFAEYVLIGTLLSTSLALVTGLLVQKILL
jgi:hypothetical protein